MSVKEIFLSLESASGEATQEIEYAFFGRLESFEELNGAASSEIQEQWEVSVDKGSGQFGCTRIRAVNDRDYIHCSKFKVPGVLGKKEVEFGTTRDMFEVFKLLADRGLRKTRYNFPVEGSDLVWEIDVYTTKEGKPCDWVKIDLEVPGPDTEIPAFPITIHDVIKNQDSQRTAEEKAFINSLFESWNLAK